MAAPVVAGTVALMLQANPTLTPNLVKAILQFTSQEYPGYDALTQGTGFLNARGAVVLAEYFQQAVPGSPYPSMNGWSKQIFWGNKRVRGGVPDARRHGLGRRRRVGQHRNAVRQQHRVGRQLRRCVVQRRGAGAQHRLGHYGDDNIVWGNAVRRQHRLGQQRLSTTSSGATAICDNIVWGNSGDDNIVWGNRGDNIVWGTRRQHRVG